MRQLVAVFFAMFILASVSKAQDTTVWKRNNLNLRIGPEIGLAAGNFNKTNQVGIGGSAQLDIPVARRFSWIIYAGARSYGSDVIPNSQGAKYRRAQVYPVRTGVNYKLTPSFYALAQVGESVVSYLGTTKTSVSQAVGLGYFNGKFDFGARWDHEYAHSGLSSFNLQLTYVITVGVKK